MHETHPVLSCTHERGRRGAPTFRFQDHHVAELALALLVEALHLDVVGGLRLQVGDGMPVPVALHHILLVVAVVVAVGWPVVDVEPVDGRVVHRRVLQKRRARWSHPHGEPTQSPELIPLAYRPFEDDAGLINGFVVGDVGAVDGALGGSPDHHRVRL